VVLDTHRSVNNENTAQFIEVLSWRAQGLVTEEEFSAIHSEWISRSNDKSPRKSKRTIMDISQLRRILFDKSCYEADLDLFVGILVNDVNRRLLHSTVSYGPLISTGGTRRIGLELCNDRWTTLSEELFFVLDSPGFGALSFDEAFFFCACVTVGMQGWSNLDELETDMSLTTLAAITIQFFHEAGGSVAHQVTMHVRFGETALPASSKYEVTMPMFKRYLIRKSVGSDALKQLVDHVKSCLEKVMRLAHTSGATDLYSSCRPYSNSNTIGSPRLWQQAVLSAMHLPQASTSTSQSTPPIVLFLLSDADRATSRTFRAIELAMDDAGTVFEACPGLSITSPLESPLAANEELQAVTYRVWKRFQKWGGAPSTVPTSDTGIGSQSVHAFRDPVYRLISHVLAMYKTLQHLLVAALFDMASTYFGTAAIDGRSGGGDSLMVTCASLSCDPQEVLIEFGFSESVANRGDIVSELKDICEEVLQAADTTTSKGHPSFDQNTPADQAGGATAFAKLQSEIVRGESGHAVEYKEVVSSKIADRWDRAPSRGLGKAPPHVSDDDTIARPRRSSKAFGTVLPNGMQTRDRSSSSSHSRKSILSQPPTREDPWIQRVPPTATVESTRQAPGVDSRGPSSAKLELSDADAELLIQILSTNDATVQNKLIEKMKQLRGVAILTASLSIAPNNSSHELSIAPNNSSHELSIAPNNSSHELSIAPNNSNHELSIAPNNSSHELSIAPSKLRESLTQNILSDNDHLYLYKNHPTHGSKLDFDVQDDSGSVSTAPSSVSLLI